MSKEDDWRLLVSLLDQRLSIEPNVWPEQPVIPASADGAAPPKAKSARGVRLFKTSRRRLRRFKERDVVAKAGTVKVDSHRLTCAAFVRLTLL